MNASLITTNIQPSDHQWVAIKKVKEWFATWQETGQQYFYLAGYAGTGKTEIAKFIVRELGLTNVMGMAYTGKAALMMMIRGFPVASTIHSAIYKPIQKGKGRIPEMQEQLKKLISDGANERLIEHLKQDIEDEMRGLRQMAFDLNIESDLRSCQLGLVDECSMVGRRIGSDLLSFGVPILVLGDPGQLPPVADGGFFTEGEPDFFLTEIHRQARDSAIIRLATMAREEGYIKPGVYSDPSGFDSVVSLRSDEKRAIEADMILVGRNMTRHAVNRWLRGVRGYKNDLPMSGEKIICLQNMNDHGLLNGAFYEMIEDSIPVDEKQCLIKCKSLDFVEDFHKELAAHTAVFGADKNVVNPWEMMEAACFDFGQAITVHKSQGSQFPHVVLNAEWADPKSWRQWLYTGVTRAQYSVNIKIPS